MEYAWDAAEIGRYWRNCLHDTLLVKQIAFFLITFCDEAGAQVFVLLRPGAPQSPESTPRPRRRHDVDDSKASVIQSIPIPDRNIAQCPPSPIPHYDIPTCSIPSYPSPIPRIRPGCSMEGKDIWLYKKNLTNPLLKTIYPPPLPVDLPQRRGSSTVSKTVVFALYF